MPVPVLHRRQCEERDQDQGLKEETSRKEGLEGRWVGAQGRHAPLSCRSVRPTSSPEAQLVSPSVDVSICVTEFHDPDHPTGVYPNRLRYHQVYPLIMGAYGPLDSALGPVCP